MNLVIEFNIFCKSIQPSMLYNQSERKESLRSVIRVVAKRLFPVTLNAVKCLKLKDSSLRSE